MGSDFKLMFPTIDDLTQELVKIGKGAHIFKIDISVLCLGILIDTEQGTVSIPSHKLQDIKEMVKDWKGKKILHEASVTVVVGHIALHTQVH